MKDVILVESPTKAKTLTRFLKGKYDIMASMGHIRDLPKGKLGVDIEKDFEPQYVIPKDKSKTVTALKQKVKGASQIILATDPDREGEAISYHLEYILKPIASKNAKFSRIVFHEITEPAINEAMEHAREIDRDLVDAQVARRVLDRIVGYKLSPVLWKKIKRGLSAGRVQSIALRLIVEREREIEKFKTENYFRVFVTLQKTEKPESAEFELISIDGKKIESSEKINLYDGEYKFAKTSLDKTNVDEILQTLPTLDYKIIDVAQKEKRQAPRPPFITSTLQIEASRRFGYSSKRTMSLAQKLYEEGFITYHRTDSFNLSTQFTNAAAKFIKAKFGEKYHAARTFSTKSKVAQEAHEAIRPTTVEDLEKAKEKVGQTLGTDAIKVFELIYKRAMATQMADAIFKSTKVIVTATDKQAYVFEKNGSVLVFDGYLKLWFYEEKDALLPDFKVGEHPIYLNSHNTEHSTTPPPRYNEASIISSLEKNGIGRPSTYATIISTIIDRQYVEKEEGRFKPTIIGTAVSDFLVKNFQDIDDIPFTAEMENKLDAIANGQLKWIPMMKEFYKPLEEKITKAEADDRIEIAPETVDKLCPKDNGQLVVRRSKFGKFLACQNFPDCTYKENIGAQELGDVKCPRDGGPIVQRRTKKGRNFFGCGNYPKCTFAVWTKEALLKELGQPVSEISEQKTS